MELAYLLALGGVLWVSKKGLFCKTGVVEALLLRRISFLPRIEAFLKIALDALLSSGTFLEPGSPSNSDAVGVFIAVVGFVNASNDVVTPEFDLDLEFEVRFKLGGGILYNNSASVNELLELSLLLSPKLNFLIDLLSCDRRT